MIINKYGFHKDIPLNESSVKMIKHHILAENKYQKYEYKDEYKDECQFGVSEIVDYSAICRWSWNYNGHKQTRRNALVTKQRNYRNTSSIDHWNCIHGTPEHMVMNTGTIRRRISHVKYSHKQYSNNERRNALINTEEKSGLTSFVSFAIKKETLPLIREYIYMKTPDIHNWTHYLQKRRDALAYKH